MAKVTEEIMANTLDRYPIVIYTCANASISCAAASQFSNRHIFGSCMPHRFCSRTPRFQPPLSSWPNLCLLVAETSKAELEARNENPSKESYIIRIKFSSRSDSNTTPITCLFSQYNWTQIWFHFWYWFNCFCFKASPGANISNGNEFDPQDSDRPEKTSYPYERSYKRLVFKHR